MDVTMTPGLTVSQAEDVSVDFLKKTVIGSVVVFGLIYWFLIR